MKIFSKNRSLLPHFILVFTFICLLFIQKGHCTKKKDNTVCHSIDNNFFQISKRFIAAIKKCRALKEDCAILEEKLRVLKNEYKEASQECCRIGDECIKSINGNRNK